MSEAALVSSPARMRAMDVPSVPAPRTPLRIRASVLGRSATLGQGPAPAGAPPPVQTAPMALADAISMLPGLQNAVQTAEDALKGGAKCPDVTAADMDTARVFRDQMAQFVAAGAKDSTLTVQKAWLDAADKVVKCAIQAEAAAPNTGAYVALGAVMVGAIVAVTVG